MEWEGPRAPQKQTYKLGPGGVGTSPVVVVVGGVVGGGVDGYRLAVLWGVPRRAGTLTQVIYSRQ